jgi:hypothetical protein
MTHEEINALKAEIFAEADNKYVAIDVCNDKQEKVNTKFANDDKRIDIIAHDFGVIKKLMWAMASASIGSLITALFELIKG